MCRGLFYALIAMLSTPISSLTFAHAANPGSQEDGRARSLRSDHGKTGEDFSDRFAHALAIDRYSQDVPRIAIAFRRCTESKNILLPIFRLPVIPSGAWAATTVRLRGGPGAAAAGVSGHGVDAAMAAGGGALFTAGPP